jgi:hypothetical protein
VWNNFKSGALYHRRSGITSVEFGIIILKKHQLFFLLTCDWFILSTSLGSSHSSRSWFSYFWSCILGELCLCSPRKWWASFSIGRLSLQFFLSGRSGMTIFKWLVFQFWFIVIHPTLIPCDSAVQKIITLAFVASK